MESRFCRIKVKRPHDTIPDFIKAKTTLRYPDIRLILDLFIFFLKKKLIEEKEVKISRFGKLYILRLSKSGNVVRFQNFAILKYFINRTREDYDFDDTKYNRTTFFE